MPAPPPSLTQGVIFDLDGVLILSSECHRQAFQEVLDDFGISNFNYGRFAGWRTGDVFRSILGENLPTPISEKDMVDCCRRKSARARELLSATNPIPADCVPVLRKLSRTHSLALASSASRESVQAFLERTGSAGFFRSTLSGDEVFLAKPDPEIVSRSVAALGLPAENCAFIDDAVAGVQAGRTAGVCAVGLAAGNAAELQAAGADLIVSSLTEFAAWLDRV